MIDFSLFKLFLDDTKVKNFVTCFKGISLCDLLCNGLLGNVVSITLI